MTEKAFWKKEKRALITSLLFAGVVIAFLTASLRKGWIQGEGEWSQAGTNVTMMQIDRVVAAEYWENNGKETRIEEAAWLHDQLHAKFGTNPVPVEELDEFLDAESNVLKAVELKTEASFETNENHH